MSAPIPKSLFTRRRQFAATLLSDEQVIEDIDTEVWYSEDEPRVLRGRFINSQGNRAEIEAIFSHSEGPPRIETSDGSKRPQVEGEPLRILRSRDDTEADGIHFNLGSLSITWQTPPQASRREEKRQRTAVFVLAGPRMAWNLEFNPYPPDHPKGNERIQNKKLDLGLDEPIWVEVNRQRIRESHPENTNYSVFADLQLLIIKTEASKQELTTSTFKERAIQIVNDLTLLTSFISKHWIDWYIWELYDPDLAERHISSRSREYSNDDDLRLLVDRRKSREFIKQSFYNLSQLRDQNLSIDRPIRGYIASHELKYISSQFTTLFSALEHLTSSFAQKRGLDPVMSEDDLKKLRDVLKEPIREKIDNSTTREYI